MCQLGHQGGSISYYWHEICHGWYSWICNPMVLCQTGPPGFLPMLVVIQLQLYRHSLSLHRQYFSDVLKILQQNYFETWMFIGHLPYLWLNGAIILHSARQSWSTLGVSEWDVDQFLVDSFQQCLSFETTPTLCDALPVFEGLRAKWNQSSNPEVQHIIQPGLDKLEEYQARMMVVPAYVLAMGGSPFFSLLSVLKFSPV